MNIFCWLKKIFWLSEKDSMPPRYKIIVDDFFQQYRNIVGHTSQVEKSLDVYRKLISREVVIPYNFKPYHKAVRKPFDYYQFGIDFIRPLVDLENSQLLNPHILDDIEKKLASGSNVVLFGNHQIEAEPQLLSILLETSHPKLAEDMIFVSGERVLKDIIAAPMSVGRSLLCIYSKKYMDSCPRRKVIKQHHNHRVLHVLRHLFSNGGKCVYVAPSGGRDRRNSMGRVVPSAYDSRSIETFLTMAERSRCPTYFYSIAFNSYDLLPPPSGLQIEIGEKRSINRVPVGVSFDGGLSLSQVRSIAADARAEYFWSEMNSQYNLLTKGGAGCASI